MNKVEIEKKIEKLQKYIFLMPILFILIYVIYHKLSYLPKLFGIYYTVFVSIIAIDSIYFRYFSRIKRTLRRELNLKYEEFGLSIFSGKLNSRKIGVVLLDISRSRDIIFKKTISVSYDLNRDYKKGENEVIDKEFDAKGAQITGEVNYYYEFFWPYPNPVEILDEIRRKDRVLEQNNL